MSHKGVVVIIPARAGSKAVPGKNLRPVAGKPLIAWTIAAARAAQSVDRIVVSTDGPQIAQAALELGAEVPFMRPAELAADDTPGDLPLLHALDWLNDNEGYRPGHVLCLQPTSPLREARDIDDCVRLALEKSAQSVVSVTAAHQHPWWMQRIDDSGLLKEFLPKDRAAAVRQDLPPVYALNGALYLMRLPDYLQRRTFFTEQTHAFLMPQERSLDIDTEWDLLLADLILRARNAT